MKIAIMVLCGLPATGKTTLAKFLTNDCTVPDLYFMHVCYDQLMPIRFSESPAPKEWKEGRQKILGDVGALLESLMTTNISLCPDTFQNSFTIAVQNSKPVVIIIDDNMYYRSMRYSYFQLAKKYSTGFCQLALYSPLDVALAKNAERVDLEVVPEYVIKNIHSHLEPPSSMNHWEKFCLSIPSCANVSEVYIKIREMLELALLHPETPAEAHETVIQNVNLIHVIDCAIRKFVSRKINELKTNMNGRELKALSEGLASKKARILQDVKAGNISVTQELSDNPTEELAIRFVENLFNPSLQCS